MQNTNQPKEQGILSKIASPKRKTDIQQNPLRKFSTSSIASLAFPTMFPA